MGSGGMPGRAESGHERGVGMRGIARPTQGLEVAMRRTEDELFGPVPAEHALRQGGLGERIMDAAQALVVEQEHGLGQHCPHPGLAGVHHEKDAAVLSGETQELRHETHQSIGGLDLMQVGGRQPGGTHDVLSGSERLRGGHSRWQLAGVEWPFTHSRASRAGRVEDYDCGWGLREMVQEGLLTLWDGEVERPDWMLRFVRVLGRINGKGFEAKGSRRGTEPGTACKNFDQGKTVSEFGAQALGGRPGARVCR